VWFFQVSFFKVYKSSMLYQYIYDGNFTFIRLTVLYVESGVDG